MKRVLAGFALLVALASPAVAQSEEPDRGPGMEVMTADPRELRAGEPVTLTGEGCGGGNQIRIELLNPDPQASVEAAAQQDGTFVETIVLPTTTKPGRTWLRATCLTPEATERVMEAVVLVSRPQFVITWTNIFFGVGAALLTAGIGLALLKPGDSHRGSGRTNRRARKRKRRRRSGSRSGSSRKQVDVMVDGPGGPELNGKSDVDPRKIEVD